MNSLVSETSEASALEALHRELDRYNQRPVAWSVPPERNGSAGEEIIEFAQRFGLVLDPWERWVLDESMGERDDGQWSALQVCLLAPRQNGKDAILEARALAGLYLLRERLILYTCHQFKTAGEAFRRVREHVDNCDALRRKVKRVIASHGEEGIELTNGARLRFIARSRTSGRGFSGDLVILNEAFELSEAAIAATVPTLSARPKAQLWYVSTAPDKAKDQHAMVLARVRRDGLSGTAARLAFMEWGLDLSVLSDAERKQVRADPRAWRRANPGFKIRLSPEFIEQVELRQFDPKTFDVERLGSGDWPADSTGGWNVISQDHWLALADHADPPAPEFPALAVETSWDRSVSVIAAYGRRADGKGQLEIVRFEPGTDWVAKQVAETSERRAPVAVVVDPGGPARSLIPELKEAGITPLLPGLRDVAGACGGLADDSRPEVRGYRHLDDEQLNLAVAHARRREVGDLWLFERRAAPVPHLMAGVLARWGHLMRAPGAAGDAGAWLI